MANLEPILFADGALRLTDHGPRAGGIVLMLVGQPFQCEIPKEHKATVLAILESETTAKYPVRAFAEIDMAYAVQKEPH